MTDVNTVTSKRGRSLMNAALRGLLVLLGMLGFLVSGVTHAAADDAPPMYTIPLSKLVGQTTPIDLRGERTIYPVFIPLSERLNLERVQLHVEYVNSIHLMGERSQLVVKLNEDVVAQLPLNPDRPEGVADIRLPTARFKPGFNRVTFYVVQHYTNDCENPDAPELWTQLDTVNSYVRFEGSLGTVKPMLSRLDNLFDRRWLGDYEMAIVTPSFPDADVARLGALITQGAAVHLEYKPPIVSHQLARFYNSPSDTRMRDYLFPYLDQSGFGGRDVVLIGRQTDLQPMLGAEWAKTVDGAYLGVFAQDDDPGHFIMVVSGVNADDLDVAARLIGLLNFPLPDQPYANFKGLKVEHLDRFANPAMVAQNTTYRFYDFGFNTLTMQGAGGGSADLEVMIPPDAYVAETSSIDVNLHFAYGAGLRPDSVMNLFINGRFENVIRLKELDGEAVRRHTITIPTRSFKPGMNKLTFAVVMTPFKSGECEIRNDRNLLFTLYDDSTIEIGGLDDYVEMPNMLLMANTGFPYTYHDDKLPTVVGLGSNDSTVMASSWTLMGKLAQISTHPINNLSYRIGSYDNLGDDVNLIAVGPVKTLDSKLFQLAPLKLGEESILDFTRSSRVGDQFRSTESRLWINADEYGSQNAKHIYPTLDGFGLGESGLMMQFSGDGQYGETVTLVTAMTAEHLYATIRELTTPEVWSNVQGDVTLWRVGEEEVYARNLGEKYYLGQPRFSNRLIFHFSSNPGLFIGALVVFLLLLAFFIRWLLQQFREKHHQ